jgi:predicted alpha/beta hydrolase
MQEKFKIRTKDGRMICATCYSPLKPNGKNIIVAPAAYLVQREYRSFAVHFQQLGYNVFTFDYRGVGDSAPDCLKGCDARLQQWAVQDADAVIRYVKNSYPGTEVIYVGHGIGGELIGLAQASQYINKLVLASSSLSCKRLWSWKGRMRITALKAYWQDFQQFAWLLSRKKVGFPP